MKITKQRMGEIIKGTFPQRSTQMKVTGCHHQSSHDPVVAVAISDTECGRKQGHFVLDTLWHFVLDRGQGAIIDTKASSQSGNQPLRLIQCHYPHPPSHPVVYNFFCF